MPDPACSSAPMLIPCPFDSQMFGAKQAASRSFGGSGFKFPEAGSGGAEGQAATGGFQNEADDDDLYA